MPVNYVKRSITFNSNILQHSLDNLYFVFVCWCVELYYDALVLDIKCKWEKQTNRKDLLTLCMVIMVYVDHGVFSRLLTRSSRRSTQKTTSCTGCTRTQQTINRENIWRLVTYTDVFNSDMLNKALSVQYLLLTFVASHFFIEPHLLCACFCVTTFLTRLKTWKKDINSSIKSSKYANVWNVFFSC